MSISSPNQDNLPLSDLNSLLSQFITPEKNPKIDVTYLSEIIAERLQRGDAFTFFDYANTSVKFKQEGNILLITKDGATTTYQIPTLVKQQTAKSEQQSLSEEKVRFVIKKRREIFSAAPPIEDKIKEKQRLKDAKKPWHNTGFNKAEFDSIRKKDSQSRSTPQATLKASIPFILIGAVAALAVAIKCYSAKQS
ncbi:MAG: hypothetical protein ACOYL1_06725 [Chlamydiia bacterium]